MHTRPGSEAQAATGNGGPAAARLPFLRATGALSWLLLAVALVSALASLSTALMVPRWINWQLRLLITGLSGETGYHYLIVPLALAGTAGLLRARHRVTATATLLCSVLAFALMAKPVAQAWWIGRTLPDRLAAAFGPGEVDRRPFSFCALYATLPAPVPAGDVASGELRLELMPAMGRSPAPCVISLHGGGWFGAGYRDRRPFNLWLVRHGYAVATVGYRVLPNARWPQPRDDVLRAIVFLRAHATEFGIDPRKIVLLGRSAGAQIALATAYAAHDPGICGVVGLYAPTDLHLASALPATGGVLLHGLNQRQIVETFLGGTPDTAGANYDSASAVSLVDGNSPPTLLIHGLLDSTLPISQSEALAAKLTAAHRPNALIIVPWASHAFDTVNFDGPGGQITTYSVARFLAAVTR